MKRQIAILLLAATATYAASTSQYYWDFPTTILEPSDRILVYKGVSTAGRDRNITGAELLAPLTNYTGAANSRQAGTAAALGNHSTAANAAIAQRARLRQQATMGNISATALRVYGTTAANYATIDTGINFSVVARPPAFTATVVPVAGNVDIGAHYYCIGYKTALGSTELSIANGAQALGGNIGALATTSAGNQQVDLTLTASPDYRVTAIQIYRTVANASSSSTHALVAEVPNVTQTYRDNIADSSLTGTTQYQRDNTTHNYLLADGAKALYLGVAATILGKGAGGKGGSNVAVGAGAGAGGDTDGKTGNVSVGYGAGRTHAGIYNVAIGQWALYNAASNHNIAIGFDSLFYPVGSSNTAIGSLSGFGVNSGSRTSNNFFGYRSGYYETGSNKLMIDSQTRTGETEASQRTSAIIYGVMATTPSGQSLSLNAAVSATQSLTTPSISSLAGGDGYLRIGTTSAYDVPQSRLGIGTQTPTSALHVLLISYGGASKSAANTAAKTAGHSRGAFVNWSTAGDRTLFMVW